MPVTVLKSLSRQRRTASMATLSFPVIAWIIIVTGQPAYGFGATGHRVVGRIAERHLSPQAKLAVEELIGSETLAEVATWPDDIRSDPKWDHSAPWHFVTIEDGETYETSKKSPAGDAAEAIQRFTLVLKDKGASKETKATALKWLVHLVGDVHQPLHVGRGADRGGNKVDAVWSGEKTNIHAIWDDKIIDASKLSFSELADFIHTNDKDQVTRWQNTVVADWLNESISYRERVYAIPEPTTAGTYRYSYENLPLVKQRLGQAGVRLAGLLNEIFAEK